MPLPSTPGSTLRHRTLGAGASASCARQLHEQPLARDLRPERRGRVGRISDSTAAPASRRNALYNDYHGRVGVDRALALPLHSGNGWLVSVVLNRKGRDFSDREVALLDQVRRVVAQLFRASPLLERTREKVDDAGVAPEPPALLPALPLTWREREVLRWAAAGKTDRDIAEILAISHRTVHKHLQRVYSKLGVETRTAAVMRAIAHA